MELWSPYTHQAFSRPPRFDAAYLLSLITTRKNAVKDHLLELQFDLKYLRRYIKSLSTLEKAGGPADHRVHFCVATEIKKELDDFWCWGWIEAECQGVLDLQNRFRDSTHSGSPIPSLYDEALGQFETLMMNQVIDRVMSLNQTTPFLPGQSGNWEIRTISDGMLGLCRIPGTVNKAFKNDPLDWCLPMLGQHPDNKNYLDYSMLFAFLEDHLSHSSVKEMSRLNEVVLRELSDLSASHEILIALQLN